MADVKTTITRLNNENFFTWKFRMELFLIKENVWHVISKPTPALLTDRSNQSNIDAWKKCDDTARAWIGLLVEDNQLNYIRNKSTAKEMWDNLKEHHEKCTLSNKVILMRRICSTRMEEGGDIEVHIEQMTGFFQRLVALGESQLSDSWTVAMILSSLPASYSTLVTALETRPEADLTLSLVESKLIGEYKQRKANDLIDGRSINESAMKVSGNDSTLCFFCKRSGHMKRTCPSYMAWKEEQEIESPDQAKLVNSGARPDTSEETQEYLFMLSSGHKGHVSSSVWTVDSAATSHSTGNENLFSSLTYGNYEEVRVANDCYEEVRGKGTVKMTFLNEFGVESSVTICDVLYIPAIKVNLLSVRKLTSKGFKVNFEGETCKIFSGNDQQVGIADCCSGMYGLRQPNEANIGSRSLIEMRGCTLIDAKLPQKFWTEAIKMASYIQKRLPSDYEEANSNLECRRPGRNLYGPKQPGKIWMESLSDLLVKGGFIQCQADVYLHKLRFYTVDK